MKSRRCDVTFDGLQRELRGHLGDVYTCRFFPSGVVILTGSADMQLKIWSAEDGSCAATMRGHSAGDVTHDVMPHVDLVHVLAASDVRRTKMACRTRCFFREVSHRMLGCVFTLEH